jgi:DNA-binding MarR family transcriptional regulator
MPSTDGLQTCLVVEQSPPAWGAVKQLQPGQTGPEPSGNLPVMTTTKTGPDLRLTPGKLTETIGFQLRLAQIAAYRRFEGSLGKYGIAPRYLGLLGIIETHPGQPQSRLAEAIALKRSSLVPIIDRLEADGLVERRPSADDRRYKSVWLTSKGKRVVVDLKAKAELQEERMSAGMTAAQRQTLLELLASVVRNLTEE